VHMVLFGVLSDSCCCVLLYMLIGNESVVDNINTHLPDEIRVLGMLMVLADACNCSVDCTWSHCKFMGKILTHSSSKTPERISMILGIHVYNYIGGMTTHVQIQMAL